MNTELHRQAETYKAIRQRLWGKPQKAANENVEPVVVAFTPPKPKPSWILRATFFDEHMSAYRAHKFNRYISFIKQRCQDIGIEYEEFINTGRKRKGSMKLSMKRHQIRWELKKKYPELTLLALSRMCGGLDHTSIINSIKKMDKLVANGYELQGVDHAAV